jgi:formylglycine-generating enzyme required for sulfatase activity
MKKMIFVLSIFLIACGRPAVAPTVTSLPPTATPLPPTNTPSLTPTSTPSPTGTLTPTITSIPNELTDEKGVTMRLVPAGEFMMGVIAEDALLECQKHNSDCALSWFSEEEPLHTVYLDAFYMDIYEVTNASYGACVDAGVCTTPIRTKSSTRFSYYGDSRYDNYPVIN